ncbi:hypothetical protein BDV93DRAFT_507922 [Ceratobasidium sp. AG-I]|nr:hypothetical protein BDV93DRAFT_507922 [Ceratobasidium sp. AG-I]
MQHNSQPQALLVSTKLPSQLQPHWRCTHLTKTWRCLQRLSQCWKKKLEAWVNSTGTTLKNLFTCWEEEHKKNLDMTNPITHKHYGHIKHSWTTILRILAPMLKVAHRWHEQVVLKYAKVYLCVQFEINLGKEGEFVKADNTRKDLIWTYQVDRHGSVSSKKHGRFVKLQTLNGVIFSFSGGIWPMYDT